MCRDSRSTAVFLSRSYTSTSSQLEVPAGRALGISIVGAKKLPMLICFDALGMSRDNLQADHQATYTVTLKRNFIMVCNHPNAAAGHWMAGRGRLSASRMVR